MDIKQYKEDIFKAGEIAIRELIKVAEEAIINDDENDISADKLKNAASSKKLAIFDALEILSRINEERTAMSEESKSEGKYAKSEEKNDVKTPFAEKFAKNRGR